jgi:hypothetical protein
MEGCCEHISRLFDMNCYKKYFYDTDSDKVYQYLLTKNKIFNDNIFYSNLDHTDLFKEFPEIKSFLESHNADCIGAGLIKIFYNKVAIHQDNSSVNGGTIRINWPVKNCEYSDTIFYQSINGIKQTRLLDNGIIYHQYDDLDCEEICRFTLDCPSALNVEIPHRVICEKFPRISLTFHFKENPVWMI